MEMQGLRDAHNTSSQHGALRGSTASSVEPAPQLPPHLVSTRGEASGLQSETNGTEPCPLLVEENGSNVACRSLIGETHSAPNGAFAGLHHLNSDREFNRTGWRCVESGDSVMALPLFDGEDELQRQLAFSSPGLAQQQPGLVERHGAKAERPTRDLFVIFNTLQEDGASEERRHPHSDEKSREVKEGEEETSPCEPMEAFRETLRSLDPFLSLVTPGPAGGRHTVEDVILTNKYGDRICGQVCTEQGEGKLLPEAGGLERPEGTSKRTSPGSASPNQPASETFSGTITINNQSIIVTIENGILTLAAPPEGHVHKEDGMVSLKEHLGMKDHEDIVLLNYDSGTKSIGKISTLAVSSPQEEPTAGSSVGDIELALVDDCSLPGGGTSLHSCPPGVKEDGESLCTLTEPDLVSPSPRTAAADGDSGDFNSLRLIRTKKDAVATFLCPEPGCSCTFESRQKLKVHLLNHIEDPRPYQCTVEGCGWAFATSYKLKRHLQSHDKQRPHACQMEGCGRRFTTVYNLKAHLKVHEQDQAFICDICNEKFRSTTRLTNHQRVHFEPHRPHKCEFPGGLCFRSRRW